MPVHWQPRRGSRGGAIMMAGPVDVELAGCCPTVYTLALVQQPLKECIVYYTNGASRGLSPKRPLLEQLGTRCTLTEQP